MKTLILSCNTGEGHNSCAKAIKEYYDSQNEVCVIQDGLKFISPKVSHFISWGHTYIYRHLPLLFKIGYTYSEKHPATFYEGSCIYRFVTQCSEKIFAYITEENYDAVICTHVFTALMVTDMLKKHPMNLATGFVSTDYTCSPITKESNLDYYFIPDLEFATDFECETITEQKMIPSGIPVRQMFYIPCAEEQAKMSVDIDPDQKHLLMMCGSMGCGPMKKLLNRLSTNLPDHWELSVVCGKNKKLAEQLEKQYSENKKVHIHSFVKDMGTMMDSADLYLTKPGGLSVTEAMVKNLPMVFVDAVAGCEEYNRIHFIRIGGARTGATVKELCDVCQLLMRDEERRQKMHDRLEEIPKRNAAQIIYQRMGSKKNETKQEMPCAGC